MVYDLQSRLPISGTCYTWILFFCSEQQLTFPYSSRVSKVEEAFIPSASELQQPDPFSFDRSFFLRRPFRIRSMLILANPLSVPGSVLLCSVGCCVGLALWCLSSSIVSSSGYYDSLSLLRHCKTKWSHQISPVPWCSIEEEPGKRWWYVSKRS